MLVELTFWAVNDKSLRRRGIVSPGAPLRLGFELKLLRMVQLRAVRDFTN